MFVIVFNSTTGFQSQLHFFFIQSSLSPVFSIMGDIKIKVRDLSELLNVESVQSTETPVPFVAVKKEVGCVVDCHDLNVETKVPIKVESEDYDNKVFPVSHDDVADDKFKLVLQLLKRTIKIQQCMCEQCGSLCDSKKDLHLHNRHYHHIPSWDANHRPRNWTWHKRGFLCLRCSKRFATYRQRQHHMFIHRNVSPFVCRYCNKRFPTVKQTEHHSRYGHIRSGAMPMFVCRNCYSCFYQVKHYERHLHVHNEPFKCTICFQRFRQLNIFHGHLVEMHSKETKKVNDPENVLCAENKIVSIKKEPKESQHSSDEEIKVKLEDYSGNSTTISEISLLLKKEPKDAESTAIDGECQCERCSMTFACEKSFLIHEARHVKGLKRFHCVHCRWCYFSSKRKLDRHTKEFHSKDDGSKDVKKEEKATTCCEDGVPFAHNSGENEGEGAFQFLSDSNPKSDKIFVVDEVGDVDMSGFDELIKKYLS